MSEKFPSSAATRQLPPKSAFRLEFSFSVLGSLSVFRFNSLLIKRRGRRNPFLRPRRFLFYAFNKFAILLFMLYVLFHRKRSPFPNREG